MNVGKVHITVTHRPYVPILLDPLPALVRMVILVMVYLVAVRTIITIIMTETMI